MTDIKVEPIPVTDLPDASPSDPLEALSWLGDSVEEIAEGLRARGIKGKHKDPEACPLASYLKLWWEHVGVGRTICHADNWPNGELCPTRDLPLVFGQFVARFDGGAFPDLIDNG